MHVFCTLEDGRELFAFGWVLFALSVYATTYG